MARALQCDRCGQFFAYMDGIKKYRIRDMDYPGKNELDLCPVCYDELTEWLYKLKKDELTHQESEDKEESDG